MRSHYKKNIYLVCVVIAAAGISNGTIQLFDVVAERGLSALRSDFTQTPGSGSTVCGLRFLDETSNCLLVGTTNGYVRLFDLRAQREQALFDTTSESSTSKTITSFDCNANSRILCAGKEKYQDNVFLLFFDIRERRKLGGYFESHTDDITSIRFHERDPDLLCSGSTDGYINVYNIKEETEEDALLTTINTESSVDRLNWHKNVYEQDIISCITHTDFMLYKCEDGDEISKFERPVISTAIKRTNPANCNIINVHNMVDNDMFLLVGTNLRKGEVLRSLHVFNKTLVPLSNFEGNKQIVRESVYDMKTKCLLTAGETGIVSLWTPITNEDSDCTASKLKAVKKYKTKKIKPY
ncbi:WD repeat-containing protein 89 isoform X2 [Teleopsis dalmanni]|uniref:WD repeat-containing protein 89 isoform X2 n=1 Tax=Teleopsis dalmanni TaxID=139649 RepID=UPI0018CCB348|nr:WD repeat-containing protein 89 isoform X2 [Teleopsis dalmanni]